MGEIPAIQGHRGPVAGHKTILRYTGALISVFPESRHQAVTVLENVPGNAALDRVAKGTDRAIELANKTKKK